MMTNCWNKFKSIPSRRHIDTPHKMREEMEWKTCTKRWSETKTYWKRIDWTLSSAPARTNGRLFALCARPPNCKTLAPAGRPTGKSSDGKFISFILIDWMCPTRVCVCVLRSGPTLGPMDFPISAFNLPHTHTFTRRKRMKSTQITRHIVNCVALESPSLQSLTVR